VNIFGIETSCDETSAAVVADGRRVLSNIVFSQSKLHAPYGGVVPEIASRSHVERIRGVVEEALRVSGLEWEAIDGVAATYGPGLASSLMVGLAAGRALAVRLDRPFRAVNHIEAHVYSPFLSPDAPEFERACPLVALVISGGHTSLFRVSGLGRYELLGQTIDDAAGEAFDKGANLLGLGYPGGPAIDRASRSGNRKAVRFPRGRQRKGRFRLKGLDHELCFSFSGLKTSLLYHIRDNGLPADAAAQASLAASYQEAIVDAVVERCDKALREEKALVVGGGVSLNSRLRERLRELAACRNVRLLLAQPEFCADNGAMIAGLAGMGQGIGGEEALRLDIAPSLTLP